MSITLPESLSRPRPRRQDFRRAKNYYAAAISEAFRTPLQWYGRAKSRGRPSSPATWKSGLILGPCHIGDVLYNTASLPFLNAGLPDCEWSYAVSGPSAQVLEGNPFLKEVIAIPGIDDQRAASLAILAERNFDAFIAYTSGPPWREMSIALDLGIPNRVGYVHKGFSALITHPIALRFPQPFPAYFRDLVAQLVATNASPPVSLQPQIYLREEHERAADLAMTRLGIDRETQPILACSVTSRQPTGMWPEEQFERTIKYVREQEPCAVVYIGAKTDESQLRRLADRSGADSFVLAGDLDLLPLVAFLRRCRAALTPDSGARHLANAAGIPVVFLRNLFNRKIETGSYCETDHDMSPDDIELVDPVRQAAVFAAIDPKAVAAEVIRLLRRA